MEFSFVILYLVAMIYVVIFTLMEHKFLAMSQSRSGPNVNSLGGVLNSVFDALKLLQKDCKMEDSSMWLFLFPWLGLFLTLVLYTMPGHPLVPDVHQWGLLIFLLFTIGLIYPLLLMSGSSSSKYAILSCMRSIAQMVSYDMVSLVMIIYLGGMAASFSYPDLYSGSVLSIVYLLWFFLVWLFVAMAESHRSPFDLSEGESELVSGFLSEFSGVNFLMVVLYEYMNMILYCYIFTFYFFVGGMVSIYSALVLFGLLYMYVWARASSSRFRYDFLMEMAWKWNVPVLFSYCMFASIV